ncbi:unnamed protein product [Brassica oleracea]
MMPRNSVETCHCFRNTKSVYSPVHTAHIFQSTSQLRGAPASRILFYPNVIVKVTYFHPQCIAKSYKRPSANGFDQHCC